MKNILYITNLPAPYKIDFLNELGKYVNLTVAFERTSATNRDPDWKGTADVFTFKSIWLTGLSIGTENSLDYSIVRHLHKEKYDLILLNGYSSMTEIMAIGYMNYRSIPFGIVCDGMFAKDDSPLKRNLKKKLIGSASFWLSPGHITDEALIHYGAEKNRIYWYPFTSVKKSEIAEVPYDRTIYKKKIGCDSTYMILYVGQMIPRKGIDVLLQAISGIELDCKTYLIGGKLADSPQNAEIVNIGFLSKVELADYYKAADVFVLPSREDIWGLVINEAMAYGTPVISTVQCGAALEMIVASSNGSLVPVANAEILREKIVEILERGDSKAFMINATMTARKYTIEAMAEYTLQAVRQYCCNDE